MTIGPIHVRAARFCITDRYGGVSRAPYDELNLGDHVGDEAAAVEENRHRLAARLRMRTDQLVFLRQVHGRQVARINGSLPAPTAVATGMAPEADAAVTTRPDLALVVLVADCVPVLFACDDPRAVGVAHAGRRGLVAGIIPATLSALARLGAHPERIAALVGPAICGACYEVPAHVQEEVAAEVPAARATSRTGTTAVDVRAGVLAQLRHAGVSAVEVDDRCTLESPELYSYRRQNPTGRFAGVAWLSS